MDGLPGYSFFITEGQNTQEILLGIAPGTTAFLTQKIEFQSRDSAMRPGAFLTVRASGADYSMLFLHLASMTDARGFGLRTDMIERAFEFKRYLDKVAGGEANFMFLGDLNVMGLDYVYGKEDGRLLRDRISAEHELAAVGYRAEKAGMRVLSKTVDSTWRGSGKMRSDLDHVVASEQFEFEQIGGSDIEVRDWPQLPKAEQAEWVEKFSDHALLYFEVSKAGELTPKRSATSELDLIAQETQPHTCLARIDRRRIGAGGVDNATISGHDRLDLGVLGERHQIIVRRVGDDTRRIDGIGEHRRDQDVRVENPARLARREAGHEVGLGEPTAELPDQVRARDRVETIGPGGGEQPRGRRRRRRDNPGEQDAGVENEPRQADSARDSRMARRAISRASSSPRSLRSWTSVSVAKPSSILASSSSRV